MFPHNLELIKTREIAYKTEESKTLSMKDRTIVRSTQGTQTSYEWTMSLWSPRNQTSGSKACDKTP
jgi:hypothetical protein